MIYLDKARIERARTQRLCIESDNGVIKIIGTQGIIYDVNISKNGVYCSCPDHAKGHICKHIIYILIKKYKANVNLNIEKILENLNEPSKNYEININSYDECGYIKPRLDTGDCSICLDTIISDEKDEKYELLDWCKFSCGNVFHAMCIENYKRNLGTRTLKCPLCREKFTA